LAVSAVPASFLNGASSRVHLRSPVRSFPCPVSPFGSEIPWTSPRASHPAVTSDACRGQEQASDTSQGLAATQPKRPRVARCIEKLYAVAGCATAPTAGQKWLTLGLGR